MFYCDEFTSSSLEIDNPSENVEHLFMPLKEFKKLVDRQEIVDPMLLIAWHTACNMGYLDPKRN